MLGWSTLYLSLRSQDWSLLYNWLCFPCISLWLSMDTRLERQTFELVIARALTLFCEKKRNEANEKQLKDQRPISNAFPFGFFEMNRIAWNWINKHTSALEASELVPIMSGSCSWSRASASWWSWWWWWWRRSLSALQLSKLGQLKCQKVRAL